MRQRTLGSGAAGCPVSAIGIGCMAMSGDVYGGADEGEAVRAIHRAIDLGVSLIDTADVYGLGHNERLVGRAVAGRRDQVVLATKFGNVWDDQGRVVRIDGTPGHVRRACEDSLRRLGVDLIDLYYLHRLDPDTPVEDTVGAMGELVGAGMVRYLGLSEVAAATLRRAHRVHPVTALQSEYSLWTRDVEASVLPACHELGIGFVAYSPLGRGFLTGAISAASELGEGDWRHTVPRFEDVNLRANLRLVATVRQLAGRAGTTPAQLALAWLLSRDGRIVPIPGSRRVAHVEENVAAADVDLGVELREELDAVLADTEVLGERYPEEHMQRVGL